MKGSKKLPLKDRVEELEKMLANLQMAMNISQAMIKNINSAGMKVDQDVSNMMGVVNDLQYRTLSMMENKVFSKDELNKVADSFKLKDFTSASDKEDADKGFTVSDETDAESIVIITSTTKEDNNDASIFRSKLAIKDTVLPELKEKLVGKKVGDHVTATINNLEHDIEILGIRKQPKEEIPAATAVK